ncbi:MAG: NfeD family protein [Alphaproteobacteria bacterium]|nr:NfeD family protein [Alphaproteobacteria bacterium]
MIVFLEHLTVWHWVGLGLILLTAEIAVGTFDLLWVAMAAFVTALFTVLAPGQLGEWQGQLVVFGVVAVAFVLMGRTVFRGLRRAPSSHPNINDRMASMVGKHGQAGGGFEEGAGRVKIGDTMWSAIAVEGATIMEGDDVVVAGADGTTLKVRRA